MVRSDRGFRIDGPQLESHLVRKRIYKGGQFEDVFCWAIARRQ